MSDHTNFFGGGANVPFISETMADGVTTRPFVGEMGQSYSGDLTPYYNEPHGASSVLDTEVPYTIATTESFAHDKVNGVTYITQATGEHWSFDIDTEQWTALTSVSPTLSNMQYAQGIVKSGKIYYVGFYDVDTPAWVQNKVRIYDIALDSWSESVFASGTLQGTDKRNTVWDGGDKIYLSGKNFYTMDEYTISTNTVVAKPNQTATAGVGTTPMQFHNGFLYFIGYNNSHLWKYRVSDGQTTFVTKLPSTQDTSGNGFAFIVGDIIYIKQSYSSLAFAYNITTKILQVAYTGLGYASIQSRSEALDSSIVYNGSIYGFQCAYAKQTNANELDSPYVTKIDLSVPMFMNIKKEA